MNPDKLFDYLDGRLPDWERSQLEERLLSDPQLQRELEMARQIHARTRGDLREVLLENNNDTAARGRKLALRVGSAFILLIGLNVAIGLWLNISFRRGNMTVDDYLGGVARSKTPFPPPAPELA